MSNELKKSFSLSTLLQVLRESPSVAIRRCQEGFQQSELAQNTALYVFLAFLVEYVRKLKLEPRDLREFMEELRRQGGPTNGLKEDRLPILAVKMMMRVWSTDGSRYEQVRTYGKIVQYFVPMDIVADDIPQTIEDAGGIYKLLDSSKQIEPGSSDDVGEGCGGQTRARAAETGNTAVNYDDDADELHDDETDDELPDTEDGRARSERGQGDQKGTLGGRHGKDPTSAPTLKTANLRKKFNPAEDLAIEAGRWLTHLLDYKEGEEFWIRIRMLPDQDDWRRFEMINLDEHA